MAMAKVKPAAPTGPEIFDCEQGTDQWRSLRCGIVTASVFSTVMANGRDGGASITRTKLLHKLAGEILTGEPAEEYRNAAMDRGNAMEAEAREVYAQLRGDDLRQVGFVKNFTGLKHCGCSPDSLVSFDGGLEIKTAKPDVLIPLLLKGAQSWPQEHKAQVQGNMWICEREFWDLFIYWPKLPPFLVRLYRDEKYIKEMGDAVERFNFDLKTLVEQLKRMGG